MSSNHAKRPLGTTGDEPSAKRPRLGDVASSSLSATAPATSLEDAVLRAGPGGQLGRRILTVGEGDFSLSHALVQGQDDCSNLTASTIRMASETRSKFPSATARLVDLVTRGATVLHGVNACFLPAADGVRDNYDSIIFTFPYADHPANDTKHQSLVTGFLRSASRVLRNEGEILLTLHVSKGGSAQFDTWKVQEAAQAAQLQLIGSHTFNHEIFPAYNAVTTTGSKFRFHRATTYIFRRQMDETYNAFRHELQSWAEQANSQSLLAAIQLQLQELKDVVQSRLDRGMALELSRCGLLQPAATAHNTVFPAGRSDQCLACSDTMMCLHKLSCEHEPLCMDCLGRMSLLALKEQNYEHLRCPYPPP